MAIRHVRAAQRYAQTTEPAGRAILAAIMQDVGWQGQPARPTRETLAERTGYHPNSVGSWVKRLAAAGDLVLIEVGRHYEYQPPAAWDCDNQEEVATSLSQYPVTIESELSQNAGGLSQPGCDNPIVTIEARLSQIEQRLSQIEARLSQFSPGLSQPGCDLSIEEREEEEEEGEGDPPPPTAAPPAAGTEPESDQDAYADEMWQLAQGVVGDWLRLVGHYRKLSPQNAAHSADYYAPAVRLVHEFGGNRAAAWAALEAAYQGMLHAGMTPRRLAPVVEQVIGNLNRQRSPVPAAAARPQPSANGSGGQQPRAVAALEEFKRRLAQQESDA